jgi:ubiquinone/menaquinone biosynthesis C-methylase UbiE
MAPASSIAYIMEDPREGSRLEQKIDPDGWVRRYLDPLLFAGAQILDVGCGPGTILRAATAAGKRASGTGVDVGPARVRQAKEKHADNRRLQFQRGDVQELEFESGSFDVVYARMLLQYVADKEKAVAEMVRVCKPGGTVLIQDLDGQLVWHYPEDALMQECIARVLQHLQNSGFDPFVGRKLFWLARNAGLDNLRVQAECYHLIAGGIDAAQYKQWKLKLEIAKPRMQEALGSEYEADEEIRRFLSYLRRPDTLTYSNVFTVSGEKPR